MCFIWTAVSLLFSYLIYSNWKGKLFHAQKKAKIAMFRQSRHQSKENYQGKLIIILPNDKRINYIRRCDNPNLVFPWQQNIKIGNIKPDRTKRKNRQTHCYSSSLHTLLPGMDRPDRKRHSKDSADMSCPHSTWFN